MKYYATLCGLAVVLAGCSSSTDGALAVAEGGEKILCAIDGAKVFSESCAVDRSTNGGVLVLTARHPNGAFRRFAVVSDGRGLIVADGAEQAVTELSEGNLAVSVGRDRYLFPAKAKPALADPERR